MLNWSSFSPPPSWKQNGRESRGPCPVTGEGDTKSWAVPDDDVIGCRLCGDPVSGKLTGAAFREHAAALGLVEVNLGASGGHRELARWTFTTADRQPRDQIRRAGCGQSDCGRCHGRATWKHWQPVGDDGRGDGPLAPRCLLYLPGGELPTAPVVFLTEGASDADALHAIGLPAIGRPGAKPSAESLARFDSACAFRIFPDHDDNGAGYRQAVDWHGALTAAGLEAAVIDPLELRPDAPSGYDARDWCESLPVGTTPEAAGAMLDAAVVDVETIRARMPAAAAPATPVAAPSDWQPPRDGLPVPRQSVELCDSPEGLALMLARRSAGRLRCIVESGEWLYFLDGEGWRAVLPGSIEEAIADCARKNIGTRDKDGDVTLRPAATGRRSVARDVAGLLAHREEIATHATDWDAARSLIVLPGGDLLDVLTGERRRPSVDALHRRRVRVDPASPAEFAGSRFRRVVEHVVPDPAERQYLQRRLGAALVDAEGMDDLIWLFGPPGCGKGTLVQALKETTGGYAAGVPKNELLRGMNKGHLQWQARLAGCRFLFADDLPVGHYLDDATINTLLGSEITAHHMYSGSFDFRLQAPLICTSNAPPQITSTNVRRLRPIQCGASVENADPKVRASMSTDVEIAACLRWLIDGAADWNTTDRPVPPTILERANEAAAASPVAEFTALFQPGDRVQSGNVFTRWREFKAGRGEQPGSHRAMVGALRGAGWTDARGHGGVRLLVVPLAARVTHGDTSLVDSIYARSERVRTYETSKKSVTHASPGTGFPP